jgi:hypothetical protein
MKATAATRAARRERQAANLDWFWRVDAVDRRPERPDLSK